jgi:leucyl/phenylalanyl-tRNA---protein transferase
MAIPFPSGHALLDLVAKAPYSVRQALLGTAYRLMPRRLSGLIPLTVATLRDLPRIREPIVPDPSMALDTPDGLCGLAGRIGVPEMLEGYRRGMFPMSHIGPLKWWAPRHRMVLFFDQARIEKGTRRLLRQGKFQVTFDRAFSEVMRACAQPRPGGTPLTWITPRITALLEEAHQLGHAHSVEVWQEGALAGGIFGLAVGRVFFTESQFHTVRDSSKVGFAVLNRHLQAWGFAFNDGQHPTRYLADCGMEPVTRAEFSLLTQHYGAQSGYVGRWDTDPALMDDKWQPEEAGGFRREHVLPHGSACPYSVDELLTTQRSCTW